MFSYAAQAHISGMSAEGRKALNALSITGSAQTLPVYIGLNSLAAVSSHTSQAEGSDLTQ